MWRLRINNNSIWIKLPQVFSRTYSCWNVLPLPLASRLLYRHDLCLSTLRTYVFPFMYIIRFLVKTFYVKEPCEYVWCTASTKCQLGSSSLHTYIRINHIQLCIDIDLKVTKVHISLFKVYVNGSSVYFERKINQNVKIWTMNRLQTVHSKKRLMANFYYYYYYCDEINMLWLRMMNIVLTLRFHIPLRGYLFMKRKVLSEAFVGILIKKLFLCGIKKCESILKFKVKFSKYVCSP